MRRRSTVREHLGFRRQLEVGEHLIENRRSLFAGDAALQVGDYRERRGTSEALDALHLGPGQRSVGQRLGHLRIDPIGVVDEVAASGHRDRDVDRRKALAGEPAAVGSQPDQITNTQIAIVAFQFLAAVVASVVITER